MRDPLTERDQQLSLVAQMRRGMLQYCTLALIEWQPSYGRELVDALGRIPGMAITTPTIYPVLGRLAHQRLVTGAPEASWNEARRRYYRLTERGLATLDAFEREWRTLRAGVEQVLGQRARGSSDRQRAG